LCVHPFPLVPLRSFLVVSATGALIPVALSWKSVLFVYLRMLTIIIGVASLIAAVMMPMLDRSGQLAAVGLASLAIGLVGLVVGASTWLLRSAFMRCSGARGAELRHVAVNGTASSVPRAWTP
jgi:hypothetical protein